MDDLGQFIHKFLEIIDYKQDRASFIKRFLDLIKIKATFNLYNALTQEKQKKEKFKSKMTQEKAEQLMAGIIKENYSEKQILESTQKTAQEMMTGLLDHLKPRLNEKQWDQLVVLAKHKMPSF